MKILLSICIILFSFNILAVVQFSSPHVQRISFNIDDGIVISGGSQPPELVVSQQLRYMFGVLNEVDAGVDFPQMKVEITSIEGNEIHYKVRGEIAWDKKRPIPRSFFFPLPRSGDNVWLTEFVAKYQKECARKPSSLGSFWNYYRPHRNGCAIHEGDRVNVLARFNPSVQINNNLMPNYQKIFQDSTLEMTVIMTKDHPLDLNDLSLFDFQTLCGAMVEKECHIESFQGNYRILLHVFLLDNFADRPQVFLSQIQNYLQRSDVVSYNGHSGMGANIESFVKYYPIEDKEKYQIFFFNSCDTYGYFRNEFIEQGNRDVILNATPNYFGTFAYSNNSVINGLLKNISFEELMKLLPLEQRPLVILSQKDR